ncbi:MAG TPA: hypothetical protein VE344_03995 [Methylomirabilota bacterium]|nr:hypothetical protein [Methylomirabilota bacterium]
MKIKLNLIVGFCFIAILASADTRIIATVENVYGNSILLNWSPKRDITRTESWGGASEGNFMSGGSTSVKVGEEYIFQKEILIVNYPIDGVAEGQKLNFEAKQIGTTNFLGKTIELWDAGYMTITPEKIKELKKWQAETDAFNEKQKEKAQKIARDKMLSGQTNAVRWLQPQATNGSASAQCSLGEHYLVGLGCETNKTLAIFWLQKAAAQGDSEASNKLVKINLVSTNTFSVGISR